MTEQINDRFESADDEHGLISVFLSIPTCYGPGNEMTELEEQLTIRCDYMDIEEEETMAFSKTDIPRLINLLQSFVDKEKESIL